MSIPDSNLNLQVESGLTWPQAERLFLREYTSLLHWVSTHHPYRLDIAGMSPEAVVHELYFRLSRHSGDWASEAHLANWMRRSIHHILIDGGRRLRSRTRSAVDLSWSSALCDREWKDRERDYFVRDALGRMGRVHPRQAAVVSMRHLEGYSVPECAGRLGISERTVKRDCSAAFKWLRRELAA